MDQVAEPPQPERILQHRPRCSALMRVAGEHAAEKDRQVFWHYDEFMAELRAPERRLAILSYHKVGDPPRAAWEPWNYVPEAMLAEQLSAVHEDGWQFVELADALRGVYDPDSLPARSALVTFDDGYRSVLERGLPVLRDLGCPAVVFMPAAFIGGVSTFDRGVSEPLEPLCGWDELRELQGAGISVQSHGFKHLHFSKCDPELLEAELKRSKRMLEEGLERTVELFAFPYGDGGANPAAVTRALEHFGYRAACLYGGGAVALPTADRYRLSRLAIGFGSDVVAELAVGDGVRGSPAESSASTKRS
ncbi:MAG: polysaccharide deacetylase family protein [Solirubrobacterales bacterium]|nr:polysaccharide deacetylase family protein [Solirubrobacterales bacterium]